MNWLSELLRCFSNPPKPSPTEYLLTSDQIFQLVKDAKDHVYMWDSAYWSFSLEDWRTVIQDVRAGLPIYLAEKFDCEDFAFLMMTRVAERYKVNTMGVAVGQVPFGYHGFNLFVAMEAGQPKLHILEPQTGQLDPPGYSMETVIFC